MALHVCVWWMSLEFFISDRIGDIHVMRFSSIYRSVVGRALANEVSRLINMVKVKFMTCFFAVEM